MNRVISVVAACVFVATAMASADSIWNKANGRIRAVYCDDTAKGIGDNLTIVINEQTKIENSADRKMQKDSSRAYTMSGTVNPGDIVSKWVNKVWNAPTVNLQGTGSTEFEGKADYGASRSLVDQITVTVEDVLPNGNLVVVGKREREVSGDKQIIEASGIVRLSDIAFDNTISSDKIANFQITLKNKGQENDFTNPGWFARFLNFFNPS